MGDFDATGFLISLSSMSVSVSLLLGLLALLKERLLTRYRARTLYQLGLLLTVLLLCPWRPALLLPRITLPAAQVMEASAITEDAYNISTQNVQASDDKAAPGMTADVATEADAVKTSGEKQRQAGTSPAAAPSTHQRSGIPWVQVLFAVWLAGTLTVLLFQTVRHARFLRLIRRWQSPVPPEVQAALMEQCAYLRITMPPAFTVPCVQSPTVVGLLRPVLLLPEIKYDPQQLDLMLTHELIHLKHRHLWGKALCCLVSAVHWFNPLMPYLMHEMGLLCEMACDEEVLELQEPEHQSAYVDAILHAVLLTKAVRTPLCSPLDGGVKQMNRIKQRIALMTPFRPRRAGAGLIACMLLLALLTGSVLADKVSASAFVIPESDWISPASEYMPQADYDLLMSMQTPGWEELSTEEYAKQITPELPNLEIAMHERWPENRFMRHLQYSMAEAHNPIGKNYKMKWYTNFHRKDDRYIGVYFDCDLNWKYTENAKLSNGERDRLLDGVLLRASQAVRALNVTQIQGAASQKIAGDELGAQLNETTKELGGNEMSIWLTNVNIDVSYYDDNIQLSQEQQEHLSLLTPEGYRDQTVSDYNAFLETNKDHFDLLEYETKLSDAYDIVGESYGEKNGYPYYLCSAGMDLFLMPSWTMRGSISYLYQLNWKTIDPDHVTVGERHNAIRRLMTRFRDAVADMLWEKSDWESFDKTLKERLPVIAQEESTPMLTFTVSEIGLELMPLATETYVHSEPDNVLKAFMTSCYNQDTAQMASVCVPVGTDATNAGVLAQREQLFKSLVEMQPCYWTFGEVKKDSGKGDEVTVDLTFYKRPLMGEEKPVEEKRQARLLQTDGKWYLVPESLQP